MLGDDIEMLRDALCKDLLFYTARGEPTGDDKAGNAEENDGGEEKGCLRYAARRLRFCGVIHGLVGLDGM